MVTQAPRESGESYRAARCDALEEELDRSGRGSFDLSCRVTVAKQFRVSCAMMNSKNMSSRTHLKSRDSISTASTRTRKISAHSPQLLSTLSQTNGASSKQRLLYSSPSKMSRISLKTSLRQAHGRVKPWRVSSSALRPPGRTLSLHTHLGPLSFSKSSSTSHT